MSDPTGWRKERIEKLLQELRYEVSRGITEGDIPPEMGFRFYIQDPFDAKTVWWAEFSIRPMLNYFDTFDYEPKLTETP